MPDFALADILAVVGHKDIGASREFLTNKYPNKNEVIEETLQKVYGTDYTTPAEVSIATLWREDDPYKGAFVAVAYLLGASLGQLAGYAGIKKSTVYEHVTRRIPHKALRDSIRVPHRLTHNGVGIVRNLFYSFVRTDPDVVRLMSAEQVAAKLREEIDYGDTDVS